ncbi:MAG TPA: helix-turn-helix domain-containing protein [Labilithrix sp.]|nr:helix-turn-helix domain-containing protein [Labilithrix sp.]
MANSREEGIAALTELGFTRLEAEVYAVLVEESPATGYRVAQALGKAAANVYKAVETLSQKGAVLVDDGESRMLRAVPPAELLARVQRDFEKTRASATRALEKLRGAEGDERVYALTSRDQVMDRAEVMLRRARQLAAIDAFPEPLEDLRDLLVATAKRGVTVLVQVYAPADIEGAEVVHSPNGARLRKAWPAQWLNVVCDAREHLLSLSRSERGDVVQAVWSGSAYLSVIYSSGLVAEMKNAALLGAIANGASPARLAEVIEKWARTTTAGSALTGVVALQKRLRGDKG